MSAEEAIDDLVETLGNSREKLIKRIDQADPDVRQEWILLEQKWVQIEALRKRMDSGDCRSAQDLCAALGQIADEMCRGYGWINKKTDKTVG